MNAKTGRQERRCEIEERSGRLSPHSQSPRAVLSLPVCATDPLNTLPKAPLPTCSLIAYSCTRAQRQSRNSAAAEGTTVRNRQRRGVRACGVERRSGANGEGQGGVGDCCVLRS